MNFHSVIEIFRFLVSRKLLKMPTIIINYGTCVKEIRHLVYIYTISIVKDDLHENVFVQDLAHDNKKIYIQSRKLIFLNFIYYFCTGNIFYCVSESKRVWLISVRCVTKL